MPSIIDDFNGAAGVAAHVANPAWSIFGYGTDTKLYHNGNGGLSCDAGANTRGIQFNTGSNRNLVEFVVGADFSAVLGLAIAIAAAANSGSGIRLFYNAAGTLRLYTGGSTIGLFTVNPQAGDTVRLEFDAQLKTCKYYLNGALQQTISFTGAIPETYTYVNLQPETSAVPALNDIIRYFRAEPLPELDDTAPTLTGVITVDSRNTTSITTTCPEATDNMAVAGYEARVNSGAWVDKAMSRTHTFTGLPVGAAATIEWRARDAVNNYSTALSVVASTYGSGATANSILLTTGPQDGNPKGLLYDLAGTVAAGDWLNYEVISGPTPSGGTFSASPMGAFSYVGPSPAVLVIQPYVNGVATAEPITVNLYDQVGGGDTESPTLTGVITVNSKTSSSINVSCPAATDNVVVAHYEWSSNGGTSWVTGTTTHNFTGLTAGTQYEIRVRASDAAGNKSSVLSLAVTTDAEAAPVLAGAITVSNKTSTSITASCPSASGSVTGYEWSIGGAWVSDTNSHSFTGLTADTEYTVQVRAVGPGGTSAALSLSVTTDAVAAPVLSSPTASATGQTTATGSVQTTVASGTLYWLVDSNATATAAEVKAAASQAVTSIGLQNVSITGLTAGTQYYVHYLHSATGDSAVVRSAQFSTTAMASLTLGPLVNNTATVHASVSGVTVHVIVGTAVVTKTGVSTNGAGMLTVSDAALTVGATYRAIIVFADGSEGLGKVVAT